MIRLFLCILALLLGGYGVLSIRDPETAIYISNFWRYDRDVQPSDTFIRLTRVGGFFFIGLAILVVVEAFVLF